MKTEFKEVAHLYAGCNVLDNYDNTVRVFTHKVVIDNEKSEAITVFKKNNYLSRQSKWSEIKPILRPLSDITKDELSILWSIVFTREFNGVIHKHKANDTGRGKYAAERYVMSSGVERLGVEFDGNIWADSDLSVWRHNKHKITAYLLSKHFDLFGLIESGQAIDKTKQ